MRLSDEELFKIKKENNIDTIWSFSRFDCYRNSKFEFYLRYIKHEDGLAEPSPYSSLGSSCHSILEDLYNGDIKYEEMVEDFDNEFTTNISLLDLKFNRSDESINKSISKKYYEDLMHFYSHYKPWNCKVKTERAVTIKVNPGIVFVGYIDAIHKDKNGDYWITDFKTSSLYRGNAINQHAGQLTLYAKGIHQMGIDPDNIRCQWNFLRYVTVKYQQVKGDWKETIIERREIGQKLQSKAKTWLKKLGYYDYEEYLNQMLIDNSIDCLPENVNEKFSVEDCYVEVKNWQELWKDMKKEIIETIDEILSKTQEYNETHNERVWYDTDEKLKEQSYYLSQLSNYSIPQLKDYAEYLERIEAEKEAAEDLLGVKKKDDDLDWLNEI